MGGWWTQVEKSFKKIRRLRILPAEIKRGHCAEWNKFDIEMRYLAFKILKHQL